MRVRGSSGGGWERERERGGGGQTNRDKQGGRQTETENETARDRLKQETVVEIDTEREAAV